MLQHEVKRDIEKRMERGFSSKKRYSDEVITLSPDTSDDAKIVRGLHSQTDTVVSPFNESGNTSSKNNLKRAKMESLGLSSSVHPFNSDNNNICFICGMTFQRSMKSNGFEIRIQHLKRCSRKHGVSLRDLTSYNEDIPEINGKHDTINAENEKGDCNSIFTEEESLSTLAEAGGDESTKITVRNHNTDQTTPVCITVDLTLETQTAPTLKASALSINNVLMAGAKKLAQTCAILSKNSNAKKKPSIFNVSKKTPDSIHKLPYHKRIAGTNIICDGFQYASKTLSTQYFLSHFHSDHYTGLTKSWDIGLIFCSSITAALVQSQLGVDVQYLRPLPLNEPTPIENQGKAISITLIDANHCPGAVMFLISILGKVPLKNGTYPIVKRILHVGDFRWSRNMMTQRSPLNDMLSSSQSSLDELYLDTTYCLEKYRNIPTQEQVIESTIQVMENHMKSTRIDGMKCQTLYLFGSYTIGKERIYLSVAEHFGLKVYVDTKKFKILSMIDLSPEQKALLTTKKHEAFVWVVPLEHINFVKIPEYLQMANRSFQGNYKIQSDTSIIAPAPYTSAVGFRPTGWSFDERKSTNNITTQTMNGITVHGVPYSEHSSFKELIDCVQCLKPKKIIPTVNCSSSSAQIDLLRKYAAV